MSKWRPVFGDRKRCSRCGGAKSRADFYFDARKNILSSACRECTKEYYKKYRTTRGTYAWYYKKYQRLKINAKARSAPFSLTLDEFKALRDSPCYYCGQTLPFMTIDKVDPTGGYIASNCVSACDPCNRKKSAVTLSICRKVVEFLEVA